MKQDLQFFLTLVFLQDEKTGDYTAFYAQFPEASAQGRNKEEAATLLNQVFPFLLEDKKEEFLKYHQDLKKPQMTVEDKPMAAA